MKITLDMLDLLTLPPHVSVKLQARYIKYITEPKPFVIQSHILTSERGTLYPKRGSQHLDLRFKYNGGLVGFSIVGGSVEDPITIEKMLENRGKGFRAETKAVQPVEWMNVGEKRQFVKTSGEAPGIMEIVTKGEYLTGCLKPYFFEYFLKDDKYFKDWTRLVVRGIKVRKLDPKTKRPLEGQYERMWRIMFPIEQLPYALSDRAMKKGWKPPKNVKYPFPKEWAKRKFPEQYKKWLQWITGKEDIEDVDELEKIYEELSLSKNIKFALALASWMGPVAYTHRRLPQFRWYLLLDDKGKGFVRAFYLDGYPLMEDIMAAYDWGRVHRKWLSYSGKTDPESTFNPNKELVGRYLIIDSGTATYERSIQDGVETIELELKGSKLQGRYILYQEEEGSDVYVFEKASELSTIKGVFVYDEHEFPLGGNIHYDLRWRVNDNDYLEEFNIMGNLLEEEPVRAIRKSCDDLEWLEVKEDWTKLKAFGKWSRARTLDSGEIEILMESPVELIFRLKGEKLKGMYVAKKSNGLWSIETIEAPSVLCSPVYTLMYELSKEGDPRAGKPYSPFIIEQRRGWKHFIVHIYDIKKFTRCEGKSRVKDYLPDLDIPEGVDIAICLYPVPGRRHQARVAYVKFDREKWTHDDAVEWIKKNKLHLYSHSQIVKRRKE